MSKIAQDGCKCRSRCLDCGECTMELSEYYMVEGDVWAAARVGPDDGMLCIGCLEARLGRRLSTRDFAPVPVNFDVGDYRSPRLEERIFGRVLD